MVCPFTHEYTLFWTSALLYVLSAGFALPSLKDGSSRPRPLYLTMLAGGFLYQSIALYMRGNELQAFPLSNPFESLQSIVWGIVGIGLVMRQIYRLNLINAFSAIVAAALTLLSLVNPVWDYAVEPSLLAGSPWIKVHVQLAMISYALFGALAITSLMYLLQDRALKGKQFSNFFHKLPSIRKLEHVNHGLLMAAFCALTLSVAIGVLNWLAQPTRVGLDKLLVACLLWGAYAITVILRRRRQLFGSRFALTCSCLFLVALLSLWPVSRPPAIEPQPQVLVVSPR